MVTLFDNEESRRAVTRTFHIMGVNRGGTTAVAGLLMRLGIDLGDEAEMKANLEDKSFRKKLGLETIVATIRERNAAHATWGWKHPNPHLYLNQIVPELRNPRFIIVTRDLTTNAMAIEQRDKKETPNAIRFVMRQTQKNISFMRTHKLPTLLVGYEKLLLDTKAVISEISAFCNVEPDARKMTEMAEFIRPGMYQSPRGRWAIRSKLAQTRSIWLTTR